MENITGGKLNCEVCEAKPYDTTDKDADGEILLVCFTCKNAILTERNKDNEPEADDYEQYVEEALANDTPIDTLISGHSEFLRRGEEFFDSEYTTEMADRFGVGGRY